MPTYIDSLPDLIDWVNDGNEGKLTDNISIPSGTTGFPLTLVSGSILDGDGYSIIIGISNPLFKPPDPTIPLQTHTIQIKNLKVIVNNSTMTNGVLIGDIGISGSQGITVNMTITNCAVTGSFSLGNSYGGIVGMIKSGQNHNITISGCYCTGSIGTNGGGIIGQNNSTADNNSKVNISHCYSTGNIGEGGGGIAGSCFGRKVRIGNIIENCYSLGNITGVQSGGIVGRDAGIGEGGIELLSNCYSFGQITDTTSSRGSGILGTDSRNVTLRNCYARGTTSTDAGNGNFYGTLDTPNPSITTSNNQAAATAGTWNAALGSSSSSDGLYNPSSAVWTNSVNFSGGFGLIRFQGTPWDTTYYSDNNDNAQFIISGSDGDPHITTLNGIRYNLMSKGVFNLFDNNNNDARLVINADTIVPEHPIWQDKEYINNLFISYKGKRVTIKPGFRGRNAEILDIDEDFENKPQISLTNTNYKLSYDHKMFCSQCKYRTRDKKLMSRHRRNSGHTVLQGIRNSINLSIQDEYNKYNIVISNVNEDNFHPANITLKLQDKRHYDKYSGAITKEHTEYGCDIEHLHYIKEITDNK